MNILVIKHGSLGDLVLSFGAIKTLKRKLSKLEHILTYTV